MLCCKICQNKQISKKVQHSFLVWMFPGQSLSVDINVDLFVTLSPLTLDKPVQLAMMFHNCILCLFHCKVAGIQLKISFMRKLACTRNVESICNKTPRTFVRCTLWYFYPIKIIKLLSEVADCSMLCWLIKAFFMAFQREYVVTEVTVQFSSTSDFGARNIC